MPATVSQASTMYDIDNTEKATTVIYYLQDIFVLLRALGSSGVKKVSSAPLP